MYTVSLILGATVGMSLFGALVFTLLTRVFKVKKTTTILAVSVGTIFLIYSVISLNYFVEDLIGGVLAFGLLYYLIFKTKPKKENAE